MKFTIDNFIDGQYIPSEEIVILTNIAMELEKPLLLEGPPGTGKTALAKALSKITGYDLIRIQCFEGISSEQVIGEFNYTKQLLALEKTKSEKLEDLFTEDYFIKRALLQALTSEKPVVLLIDEIDRSDEEFEAFLLEALGEKQITVPELGTITSKSTPIIIMTSNGTRPLSAALRRRSLYLALEYPDRSRELNILKLHIPKLSDELAEKIIATVRKIRNNERIATPPSVAETIEFARALLLLGIDVIDKDTVSSLLGLLLKNKSDLVEARAGM